MVDYLTEEEFRADLEMDEPQDAATAVRVQRCVTHGNEMVTARVRMWSDQEVLARGSPFWRRLKFPASSAARAEWYGQLGDEKKASWMSRNFEVQMQAVERDIRAEMGSRVELVAVSRDWAGEVPLTPGAASRGGYVVRAFSPSRGW